MLLSNQEAAMACRDFMSSTTPGGELGSHGHISLHSIDFGTSMSPEIAVYLPALYAVVYPAEMSAAAASFWRLTGTGISSRQAGWALQALERTRLDSKAAKTQRVPAHPAHEVVRARIAGLMEHAPVGPPRARAVQPADVYLYPSGMSAIYHAHKLLLGWRGGESIVFGFTYELTLKIMEAFGPLSKFYAGGTEAEMDELEGYLAMRSAQGIKIQAVWCECSSNPLLRTVNLDRLRRLADQYDFVLVVDDTIGGFANVDLLGVADVVVTSLSKWFNGFADVLAGR